jgi:hypothetical protein
MNKKLLSLALCALSFAACKHRHHDQNAGETTENNTENAAENKQPASKTTTNVAVTPAAGNLDFSFFLESSGSMFAYSGTTSSFRQVVYELLTRLPDSNSPKHALAYITDKVYPTNMNFQQFMQNPDPFAAAKTMGVKTTSSELNMMLQTVANTAAQGKVGVLVSDCVYSIAKGNAIAQLDGLKYTTKGIFQGKSSNLEVLILQMEGDYNGNYYDYTNKPSKFAGKRPYYIIVMAQKAKMAALLRNATYDAWQDFASLRGYKNHAHFTTTNENASTYFSVLPTTAKTGAFAIDRDLATGDCVKGIKDCDLRKSANLAFTVAMDLSGVFADEGFKTNSANYTLKGVDNFKIEKIVAIDGANVQSNDRHYLAKATHLVTISTTKLSVAQQSLALQLNAQLPAWIAASSTDNDVNTATDKSLHTKTFGLQHLVEGIHEAYHANGSSPAFFTVKVGVRK